MHTKFSFSYPTLPPKITFSIKPRLSLLFWDRVFVVSVGVAVDLEEVFCCQFRTGKGNFEGHGSACEVSQTNPLQSARSMAPSAMAVEYE